MDHLLAVLGLGLACGLWVLFQRWVQRQDPEQPGVEGSKGCSQWREGSAVAQGDCASCSVAPSCTESSCP